MVFYAAFTIFQSYDNSSHTHLQWILLERPRLVSDHFYLATSITCPNQIEAEDIGHLKQQDFVESNVLLKYNTCCHSVWYGALLLH